MCLQIPFFIALFLLTYQTVTFEMAKRRGEEPEGPFLISYPFTVALTQMLFRQVVMVVRHGSTPQSKYDTWFGRNPVHIDPKESLIVVAWVMIDPTLIRQELSETMILLGINSKTFKFKCLSPIYDELVPVFNNTKPELESDD